MSWIGGFFGNKKSAAPGNVTVNVTLPDPLPVTLPFKHIIRDKNKERRWETNKDVKIDEGWYFIDIYNPTLNIIKIEVSGQTAGIRSSNSSLFKRRKLLDPCMLSE